MSNIKRYTDYLVGLGIDKLPHTGKSYLAHLIAVHRDLEAWQCPQEVCLGGMFHSIYGTEMFQGFTLPLQQRDGLRDLIGPRAEYLAYLNCAMDRESFDANLAHDGPYHLRDRLSGETIELSRQDFHDLCRIHLCDWLEQVPRCQTWNYRREAFQAMAKRLGGVAHTAYEEVFADA